MATEPIQDMILLQDLQGHPQTAEAFGRYLAAFSCLEQDLYIFFGGVLGSDYQGATKLLGHIQSFTVRVEAMENFLPHAKNLKPDGVSGGAIILAMAREANSYRNKLVHGTFVDGKDDKKLRLTTFLGSGAQKSHTRLISAEMINDRRTLDIQRLMLLIDCWNKNKAFPEGILTKPTITQPKTGEWR